MMHLNQYLMDAGVHSVDSAVHWGCNLDPKQVSGLPAARREDI